MLAALTQNLPEDNLGRWIFFVSTVAFANTVGTYLQPVKYSQKVYAAQVTPLTGRLFGTWTLTSSIVRLACAFDMYNATVYKITFGTYIIALGHMLSEVLVFRTAKPSVGSISPLVVASTSMLWMWMSWDKYVQ
ncbi:ergosterol biosynthesis protein [Sorochytrium milnesiophthora]